jgi:outer membrane protein, heavy metal efflux system
MPLRILSIMFVFILFAEITSSAAQENNTTVERMKDFSQYIEVVLKKHPDLKSLNAALKASKEVPDQAFSLPDPNLSFGLMSFPYASASFSAEAMTQKQIGIFQTFPAPGILKLRKKVAEDNVEIAAAMVPERRLELIKQARVLFFYMVFLEKAKEIVVKNKEILKSFLQVALTKYSVGLGLQQDVLQAQVEISKMSDLLRRIVQNIKSTGENLSVIADLPLHMDWTGLRIKELPEIEGETETLLDEAIKRRPLFEQLRVKIRRAGNHVELARKDLWPDYTVGMAYGQRDSGLTGERDDLVSLSVTLELPWWRKTKQEKKIAENLILQEKAGHELESEEWEVRNEIADLQEIDKKDKDLLILYDTGLIPQASQTVESSLADYQVDKVEFNTLVMNQVNLFDFQIKRYEIAFELQSARTRLLRALGRDKKEGAKNGQ